MALFKRTSTTSTYDFKGRSNNDTVLYDLTTADLTAAGLTGISASLSTSASTTNTFANDTFTSIENLSGSVGNDNLTGDIFANILNGRAGADTLNGGENHDKLYGESGNDSLLGENGNDSLWGGNGKDTLEGGDGADSLWGGGGNDSLLGGGGDDTFVGGYGNDTINGGNGTADQVSYRDAKEAVTITLDTTVNDGMGGMDTLIGIENIGGSLYDDRLTGNALDKNVLLGGAGNDTLDGGAGGGDVAQFGTQAKLISEGLTISLDNNGAANNVADGQGGSDSLINIESLYVWGTGNDWLKGNQQANVFKSTDGKDTLIGAGGADNYVLEETTPATDTIIIAAGESNPFGYDTAQDFQLGIGGSTVGVDVLDLPTAVITPDSNGIVDSIDAGIFAKHSISNGIVSFFDANDKPIEPSLFQAVDIQTYLLTGFAVGYIQPGSTLAFVVDAGDASTGHYYGYQSTLLLQDAGSVALDTVVAFPLIAATGISTDGLMAGSIWIS